MSLRWRNVLQACWISPAACCLKRTHISIKIDNSIRKVTFSFIKKKNYDNYTTSLRPMFLNRDINFCLVRSITHGKSLTAFCEMMQGKTEIWERRRLNLSNALLSFYFRNKIKKQMQTKKWMNKWINKSIIFSGTFSSTATSTEDNNNNNNDNDDDYHYSYLTH